MRGGAAPESRSSRGYCTSPTMTYALFKRESTVVGGSARRWDELRQACGVVQRVGAGDVQGKAIHLQTFALALGP